MTGPLLLTFNAGSSTIKIGLFRVRAGLAEPSGRGIIDLRQRPLQLHFSTSNHVTDTALEVAPEADLQAILEDILRHLANHIELGNLVAVGHRVVHGGDQFAGPAVINAATLAALTALIPLAPLHQPKSLQLIRAISQVLPGVRQSASLDTAFHRSQHNRVRRLALPRQLFDAGIKRYGFHGLSYCYVSAALARHYPTLAAGKIVIAHLGNGASLCAIEQGRSVDTSMGFSTLDGVPMATRCGALDAGVVLDLLGRQGRSLQEVEDILYHQSGLLGVSGISGNTRELLASTRPEAREALDMFTFRIAGEVARLASSLGGLHTLVFTGGIGEHQPEVRAAICARLAWLGTSLDASANASNSALISSTGSRVTLLVMATDEEQVIANEALQVLQLPQA